MSLPKVKRYARDGDAFYECDRDGNWVYTQVDIPGRTGPLRARAMAFMDSRVRPIVYASDFDQYKAAVALLRKHVRHRMGCEMNMDLAGSPCSCGASAALRDTQEEG